MKFLDDIFKREETNQDHKALLDSLSNALTQAEEDGEQLRGELSILTATGTWLEEWGGWFGLSRLGGETDAQLRARVLDVLADKVTIPALINGVKKILGEDTIVTPYEPFGDVRMFNRSTFSGTGKYPDQNFYRLGVIELKINKQPTEKLQAYINSIKSAGVSVVITYVV